MVKLKVVLMTLGAACCILGAIPGCLGQNDPTELQQHEQTQQRHDTELLRRLKNISPEQQEESLKNDKEFSRLPPQMRQRLLQRIQHFSKLSPDQQQRILNRMDTWENMTPQQRQRARELLKLTPITPER
jgi:hypothetical protein